MPVFDAMRASRTAWTFALVGALLFGELLGAASPATAANPLPWRFKQRGQNLEINPSSENSRDIACPAGFRLIWGGIDSSFAYPSSHLLRRNLEYITPATNTYTVSVENYDASTPRKMQAEVICAWADSVGGILPPVYTDFPRSSGSGRAGGVQYCPNGYRAIGGGADWTNVNTRTVDFSAPYLQDGIAVGWYATGHNIASGSLRVEVHCMEESYLLSAYTEVDISDAATSYLQDRSATATCQTGYRLLTGGALPWGGVNNTQEPLVNHGWAWISGPHDARNWEATAALVTGDKLASVAICVPASVPSVAITKKPASLSNSHSATFQVHGSDPTGEDVSCKYQLDSNVAEGCASDLDVVLNNLSSGQHAFKTTVTNESGATATASYGWMVDVTAPTMVATAPTAGAPLVGPLKMTFSEDVLGASASSIEVHGKHTNLDVPGTVSEPQSAVAAWIPDEPLVPGESYRISLTNAIHDRAGNALSPTYWDVRATTSVENTSVALRETWDSDADPIASGGRYITFAGSGGSAQLAFTAVAGQTVTVFGIRRPDGGYGDVYLDGVEKATASFYAATPGRAAVYKSPSLAAGRHTLMVQVVGTKPAPSAGTWVSIDNVAIGPTARQETGLKQRFGRIASASASGGSYDVVTHMTDGDGAPAYAAIVVGTGIKVYATKSAGSGLARILVDGVLKQTVNLSSASTVYRALVYSGTFALGQHTVRIEPVGTSNGTKSAVAFDLLTIN